MSQSITDQIWNRAALEEGGASPRPGDRALASLLLLHWLAMNGGIQHAIECLDSDDFSAAIDGFSYFGFDDVAQWLGIAATDSLLKEWTEKTEVPAINRYETLFPDDESLNTRFEAAYRDRPLEFAPIESADL